MAHFNFQKFCLNSFLDGKQTNMLVYLFILLHIITLAHGIPPGKVAEKIVKDGKVHFEPEQAGQENKYLLAKDKNCAHDVKTLCPNVKKDNNFAVFVCLQNAIHQEEDAVSDECHETMWQYKYNLTRDPQFDQAAYKTCEDTINNKLQKECPLDKITHPGYLVNCLLEHRNIVEDQKCRTFLSRMAAIVFEDYRLIKGFYDHCSTDVQKQNCGSISQPDADDQHEQSNVVSCLEDSIEKLSAACQTQLVRIAELQADDYHLDRPLFYACQEVRDHFCHDIKSGEGRIYKCLTNHINDDRMPEACSMRLIAREKMIQKDVKVDHPLWSSCQADFIKYECPQSGISEHGAGSNLLLCLQGKINEGKKVSANCQAEMKTFAAQIFENYQLNPVVVAKCEKEIHDHCKHLISNKDNGDMMDCLMSVAAEKKNMLSEDCFTAIAEVLRETGAGNNYRVDRALYLACEPAISSLCTGKEDTAMLSCLIEHTSSPKMPQKCSNQIFHLQYFMSRDFRLDLELYRDCKEDAENICHATNFNEKNETNSPDNFVVACLYRNSIEADHVKEKVSPLCASHIRRIMHQRASNIRLMPQIETPCLVDLAKFCLDKVQEGEISKICKQHIRRVMHIRAKSVKLLPKIESACLSDLGKYCLEKDAPNQEIDCLQQNYDSLLGRCRKAIEEFTKLEAKDFDLDKHLVNKCGPMVNKFCKRELDEDQGEKVLECLIDKKNNIEMDHLCTSAIEHWQLLEMKDFQFSASLKDNCLEDVLKLCKDSTSKYEAVTCLSQKIVEDFTQVSKICRHQVKKELVHQSENIQLNPELFKACQVDIDTFCKHVPFGAAQVEECLRKNHKKLQVKECKILLGKQEKLESKDNELDYRMVHVCKPMIQRYCSTLSHSSDILQCLRQYTRDRDMNPACREIVKERQIEQAEDFFLDPDLSKNCLKDAQKYCNNEISNSKGGFDNGAVFGCLVDALMDKKKLTSTCENFVRKREAEAASELNLNPKFLQFCQDEFGKLCPQYQEDEIIECMKDNIRKIKSKACKLQVKKLIVEGIEDVHIDSQLIKVCALDVQRYCSTMPDENGQVVLCLMDVYKAKNLQLRRGCQGLLEKRMSLYSDLELDFGRFDSVSAVFSAVSASPNRNYIYSTVLLILSVLFIGGILFGRFTKRVRAEMKNR